MPPSDVAAIPRAQPEPFAALFPIGAVYGMLGAALWPLYALGVLHYPGTVHASMMIEGFELAFVQGFALTVIPRFTRTAPFGAVLVRAEQALALAFGLGWALGRPAIAHTACLVGLAGLTAGALTRFGRRSNDPPEEALFLFAGLATGVVGAALLTAQALGAWVEPAPRFASRILSLGMVLPLVLGMGGLLVPTFLGLRDPLVIPRIARPHERPARRVLYALALAALAASFVADACGHATLGAWTRAAVAAIMILAVWKVWRRPRAWSGPASILWGAGWCVLAGLVAMALFPLHATGALHLVFLGGYGALTLGIASRIVVTHGGHGVDRERALVPGALVAALGLALGLRLAAEAWPARALPLLAMSGVLWLSLWAFWLARAFGPRRAVAALPHEPPERSPS